jgi:tetratricopeptide (TPR) repeat protein
VALKKLGRPGEAEAAFQRSITLAPGDTEAIYNLGNLYLEGRQFRAAMVQFLRVLDLDPPMPRR